MWFRSITATRAHHDGRRWPQLVAASNAWPTTHLARAHSTILLVPCAISACSFVPVAQNLCLVKPQDVHRTIRLVAVLIRPYHPPAGQFLGTVGWPKPPRHRILSDVIDVLSEVALSLILAGHEPEQQYHQPSRPCNPSQCRVSLASPPCASIVAERSTLGTPSSLSRRAVLTRRSVCRRADGRFPRVAAHHYIPSTLRRFNAHAHRATDCPESLTSPVALARLEGLLAGMATSMKCVTQRCRDGGIANCWPSARGSP